MRISILAIAHHRNGVSGQPFAAVTFRHEGTVKVAVVFDAPAVNEGDDRPWPVDCTGYCAVLDVTMLASGDIAFASNSWRGDEFEPALRHAISQAWPWAPCDASHAIPRFAPEWAVAAANREASDLLLGGRAS